MAQVTGMTAEAIDELMGDMVVSFHMDDNGQLIYTKRSGDEGNAGPIISTNLAVQKSHPIGSIFISAVNTDPHDLLGIGTWVRFGKGRTLVSLDEAQDEFNTNGETGGAKTVTLNTTQLPVHDHSMAHTHTVDASYSTTAIQNGTGPDKERVSSWTFGSAGDTDRSGTTSGPTNAATANKTGAAGGAAGVTQPFDNLPPYIVVYMWRRTA